MELQGMEYILEKLEEKFDNAIDIMPAPCLIYGGAVRDCLAGKKLMGDLDVLTPASMFSNVYTAFANNSKWTASQRNKLKESFVQYEKPNKSISLGEIAEFVNINNDRVQIISIPDANKIEDLFRHVKTVDIICCGVAMTKEGKVIEILNGAHQDCKNHVLRINKINIYKNIIDPCIMRSRIDKLIKRGWKNEIILELIERKISLRKASKKTKEMTTKKVKHQKEVDCSLFSKKSSRFSKKGNMSFWGEITTNNENCFSKKCLGTYIGKSTYKGGCYGTFTASINTPSYNS